MVTSFKTVELIFEQSLNLLGKPANPWLGYGYGKGWTNPTCTRTLGQPAALTCGFLKPVTIPTMTRHHCHLFHLPRIQTRAGGELFSSFNTAAMTTTSLAFNASQRWFLLVFNTSATTTTSLVSKREPEVILLPVSMHLSPPPPPTHIQT